MVSWKSPVSNKLYSMPLKIVELPIDSLKCFLDLSRKLTTKYFGKNLKFEIINFLIWNKLISNYSKHRGVIAEYVICYTKGTEFNSPYCQNFITKKYGAITRKEMANHTEYILPVIKALEHTLWNPGVKLSVPSYLCKFVVSAQHR